MLFSKIRLALSPWLSEMGIFSYKYLGGEEKNISSKKTWHEILSISFRVLSVWIDSLTPHSVNLSAVSHLFISAISWSLARHWNLSTLTSLRHVLLKWRSRSLLTLSRSYLLLLKMIICSYAFEIWCQLHKRRNTFIEDIVSGFISVV
jgi:hypothetical protein